MTAKFPIIPTDAIAADKIIIMSTVCEDPAIGLKVGFSVALETLRKGLSGVKIITFITEVRKGSK